MPLIICTANDTIVSATLYNRSRLINSLLDDTLYLEVRKVRFGRVKSSKSYQVIHL